MAQSEKTHDRASARLELARMLRKFLPESEQPPAPDKTTVVEPPPVTEVMHDAASVRRELAKSIKRVVEGHAAQMAALRERELRKPGTDAVATSDFSITLPELAKAAEVVDMKGKHKTIGAVTPKPAEPTQPYGENGSGGVIVPGKKKLGKAEYKAEYKGEPPMAKPPSGSIPGKTVPQSQPGGAPASGAPKSSAAPAAKNDTEMMPLAQSEMCSHGSKKGECKVEKCGDMKKGDFGATDSGKVATTPAQAAGGAAPTKTAASVRGTPALKIKMPGRDGTAGLVNPKLGTKPIAPGAAPAAPAVAAPAGGVKVPRPAAPMAPLGRVK